MEGFLSRQTGMPGQDVGDRLRSEGHKNTLHARWCDTQRSVRFLYFFRERDFHKQMISKILPKATPSPTSLSLMPHLRVYGVCYRESFSRPKDLTKN